MALTPMMRQYFEVKENYKDCILFFRLGDFYEMFFEDAETAAKELELVLTGRDCGLENRAPMCGIPFHAANNYIGRLISKGYKVAICEQVEDPALAKGIVKRDVIKVITPGTYIDSSFLEESKNNYIMSISINSSLNICSVALSDISTGEFLTTEFKFSWNTIFDEIAKFAPNEIIISKSTSEDDLKNLRNYSKALLTTRDEIYFEEDFSNTLKEYFKDYSGELSEIQESAAGSLMKYINETQKISLSNINKITVYNIFDYMTIDNNTRRNLELTESLYGKGKQGSLLHVMDKTETSMGSRNLRKWIEQPLLNKKHIEDRLDAVSELTNNLLLKEELKTNLKDIYDIERILGKVSNKNVNAKDLISLKVSLSKIPDIKRSIKDSSSKLLKYYYNNIDELSDLHELLDKAILDDPGLTIKDGNIIKDGYNESVDELRVAKKSGKQWISDLENRERDFTGIRSLKVGYNKVFGYYIEISKANYSSIPEGRYIRKQTLSNAERYITEELKTMEDKILGAEEKLISLEYELFNEIRDLVDKEIDRLQNTARQIAELDSIACFATLALENNYVKPTINTEGFIDIKEGRHPVVEKVIPNGEFISNNTLVNKDDKQLLLITGPNMAGKSTYMRQVALITLMAQMGSFVPAESANISIVDKIFTRIGASDDLAGGKSTFMVEMWEVSNILNNATKDSLVLLDEVGRGTSTYDGLSIAWSVIEYICKSENLRCKTLFATHYHELTKLENELRGVKNYSVAVKELDNTIVFLRKIIEGGADQSYGIEVAKLAGLPKKVIDRAKDILKHLENENVADTKKIAIENKEVLEEVATDIKEDVEEVYINNHKTNKKKHNHAQDSLQMDFSLIAKENLVNDIAKLDILSMNPMEAMNKLYTIVSEAKKLKD
ncbi:DNA mismatch repair protein MutS [Clostridium cavendishii DSM 21758]|uniref:DNA mismatch repair protein MutS n=1 Tax=Clostridium cavendishii DSM 21758 TaxID=1121302 RepID=A0A1M6FKB1_9CLOT|nr:DNA mismatch repair protein MutS [Clostridium cavendishii]SHI98082.1 DNA mismatch repair protein MutS [Clostridium cavendishii DSM 21758]